MTNWNEVDYNITPNQTTYLVMLMDNLFGGDRKMMLRDYFGKESTKDFTSSEANLAIELCLSKNESLMQFYEQNRTGNGIPF